MLGHECVREAESDPWEKGPFIVTRSGRIFHYDNICEEDILIEDIAHSLAHLCRYTGHTKSFYSVAQHSLLVADKMPGGPEEKLVGLLHDAAEAYTNDLASPLKAWLNNEGSPAYGELQDKITAAVYRRFGVTSIPSNVRLYDRAAGLFEAEAFMGLHEEDLQHFGFPVDLRCLWIPWDPTRYAESWMWDTTSCIECGDIPRYFIVDKFLRVFRDLMIQCGRKDLL